MICPNNASGILGSVDRLNALACVPNYISNTHLYANMTVVDGQLVPLMGRPAPPLPPSSTPPTPHIALPTSAAASALRATPSLIPRAPSVSRRSSRPLTKFHSSQTVWLTSTGGISDQPRHHQPCEQQQQHQQQRSRTAEVRLYPPPSSPKHPHPSTKCVVFQDPMRSQSKE